MGRSVAVESSRVVVARYVSSCFELHVSRSLYQRDDSESLMPIELVLVIGDYERA